MAGKGAAGYRFNAVTARQDNDGLRTREKNDAAYRAWAFAKELSAGFKKMGNRNLSIGLNHGVVVSGNILKNLNTAAKVKKLEISTVKGKTQSVEIFAAI